MLCRSVSSRRMRQFCTSACASVLGAALLGEPVAAQMGQYVVVARKDEYHPQHDVVVFDRRLKEQPELAVAVLGAGGISVTSSPAIGLWLAGSIDGDESSLVALQAGTWNILTPAPHGVLGMAATADDGVMRAGSMMSLAAADASLLWEAPLPPGVGSAHMAVDALGTAWMGNKPYYYAAAVIGQVDTGDGTLLDYLQLTQGGWGDASGITDLHPLADGSLWVAHGAQNPEPYMFVGAKLRHIVGGEVAETLTFGSQGAMTWQTTDFAIDGWSRLLVVDMKYGFCGCSPQQVVVAVQPDGPPIAVHDFGSNVRALLVGPTGRELFALLDMPDLDYGRRLARLNLETGVHSTVPIPDQPEGYDAYAFPRGDATGWTYASAVDTAGDADGDGVANGAEAAAGSDPYDPLSRPDGPFVGLSFGAGNAIILTIRDSDGLRDPQKGLDFGSLQLLWNSGPDVLPLLWPFVTSITVTPDWTEGTVLFGGLTLPDNLKWRLEARAADLTGALGWDWQVTPPGDL